MMNLMNRLVKDENGFVVSSELVLILTIGVIGLIVGLDAVQNAVVTELSDIASAIGASNQSYFYDGWQQISTTAGTLASTAGSSFADQLDAGDATNVPGMASNGVAIVAPQAEGGASVGPV
jgi:Flp pilus assembly pilin Flp